jgi:amidohydrolase
MEYYKKTNEKIIEEMINFRRCMHKNPELSEKEINTSKMISEVLQHYGIEHKCNVGGYGVSAIVRGMRDGKTVAAKSDIDALPIFEENNYPFKSVNAGVMHACGHDANTAMLLGSAIVIKAMEKELKGNVKFFFEPAEETIGGGKLMVEDGCMEKPKVDYIIGMHVMPHIDTGKIEIKRGCLNASTDEVEIIVHGVSGHAAEPEKCIDTIVVISYIITALQTFVSRNTAATDSAVLTFGMLHGGTKGNIIPEKAVAKGTLRTLKPEQREYSKRRIKEIAESVAEAFGAKAEVCITESYDALINDDNLVNLIEDEAARLFGRDNIVIKDVPSMGAEDFAYYTKNAKGAYFHVGCKDPKEQEICSLHNKDFHLDEKCIKIGIEIQSALLLRMLE